MSRIFVSLASVFFGALAIGTWLTPEGVASQFGLEAVRLAGYATLRADLGGLFAGLAILCGVAAATKGRAWIVAAASVLAAIVTGRALSWVSAGRIGPDVLSMAIELGILASLVAFARATNPATAVAEPRPRVPRRRLALV